MGFKDFLVKTFVPFAAGIIKAKKIAEEGSFIKGTIKYYKEYFCEDVPGTSHIYKLGKYDGEKEGFNKASDVYEQKLTDQADESIRQKELLKQETENYEELIDDMEREIEALENKLNRSEEENRALSLDAFVKIFETILNSTSYGSKFFEDENTLRDLIYLIFVDKGLNCSVEKYHAKGRCDLCIETDEDRFVFEFKISRDDSGADEKLNEALQQIEDKAYGKILPPKNLYRFAVVFSKDQKAVIKSKSLEPILLNS